MNNLITEMHDQFMQRHEERMKELKESIDSFNKTSSERNTATANTETLKNMFQELEEL